MPNKLQQVLSRADTPTLIKWIGREAGELVHLLDSRLESPSKLMELVLSLRTEVGLGSVWEGLQLLHVINRDRNQTIRRVDSESSEAL